MSPDLNLRVVILSLDSRETRPQKQKRPELLLEQPGRAEELPW
jgi:hypothetical protein